MSENTGRVAAVCENCGTALAAHVGSDGEIRPIGIGKEQSCPCGDPDYCIMNDEAEDLRDKESKGFD